MSSASLRLRGRLGAIAMGAMLLSSVAVPATTLAAIDPDALVATLNGFEDPDATGTVTLALTTGPGQVCYVIDLTLTDLVGDPPTSIDIVDGADEVALHLTSSVDGAGHAADCVATTDELVDALLANPNDYVIDVFTAAFADPAAQGTITYSYPTTDVEVFTFECPASIQSVADLTVEAASTCDVVLLPADDITPFVPAGYAIHGYAGTADFDYHVTDGVRIDQTIAAAERAGGGTCNAGTMSCEMRNFPYLWRQVAAGDTVNVAPTQVVSGFRVGAYTVTDGAEPLADLPSTIEDDGSLTIDATGATTVAMSVYLFADAVVDATKPTVTAPVARFRSGATFGSSAVVDVTWTGADTGSGIDHYTLQRSVDGGAYATIAASLVSPRFATPVAPGHTYKYRVRAVDVAGNISAWKTSVVSHLHVVQDGSARVVYRGGWQRAVVAGASGGTLRRSSVKGASASLAFFGRAVAWVAPTGLTSGRAKVYIDGKLDTTIDLRGSGAARVQVYRRTFAKTAGHTITVRVVGTVGRPRVDVDAFLYLD